MLVLHPGALTRRYISGERARFVSPLALFLFFVFLMFATIHATGDELETPENMTATGQNQTRQQLDTAIAETSKQLAAARARHADDQMNLPHGDVITLEATVKSLKRQRDSSVNGGTNGSGTHVNTGWPMLDKGIQKTRANPALALYKLQSSAYKYSWALIPISVPFVALLFLWKRRYKLYDHAIFVTYSLSFMMLLVTVFTLGLEISAPGWILGLMLAFAPPVHLFAQLRGAYELRKRSALWRTVALSIFAFIALTLFAMLLLGLGLME
jgi:hypothetical protein